MNSATVTDEPTARSSSWLRHVPVPIFASSMGVTGVGLCWLEASQLFGITPVIGNCTLIFAAFLFVVVCAVYLSKALRHPDAVAADWRNPVTAGFFAQIAIASLLLSEAAFLVSEPVGLGLASFGGVVALFITKVLFSRWVAGEFTLDNISPAWTAPGIACSLFALVSPHFGSADLGWFFFAVGLVSWIVIMPLVGLRLFVGGSIPTKMRPAMVILVAPLAVSFLAYVVLNGGSVDAFARIMLFASLFTTALVLVNLGSFLRLPFAMPWWAFTMPVAAVTLAAYDYAEIVRTTASFWIAGLLHAFVTVAVLVVAIRTIVAIGRRTLFVP